MSTLATIAKATGRELAETGGGVQVIEYSSPLRAGYVVEVTEHDAQHVSVAARHLSEDGAPCGCDDGTPLWSADAVATVDALRAIVDAQAAIVGHVCSEGAGR